MTPDQYDGWYYTGIPAPLMLILRRLESGF